MHLSLSGEIQYGFHFHFLGIKTYRLYCSIACFPRKGSDRGGRVQVLCGVRGLPGYPCAAVPRGADTDTWRYGCLGLAPSTTPHCNREWRSWTGGAKSVAVCAVSVPTSTCRCPQMQWGERCADLQSTAFAGRTDVEGGGRSTKSWTTTPWSCLGIASMLVTLTATGDRDAPTARSAGHSVVSVAH
jgi:hypothetical protein